MKAGIKTSEFWLTLLSNATVIFGAVKGVLPPSTAACVGAVLTAVYTVVRTVAKAGVPG